MSTSHLTRLVTVCLALGALSSTPLSVSAAERTSIELVATYDAGVTLDWAAGTIAVRSVAAITNGSGGPIDEIVLNSFAGPFGGMELLSAKVDGVPVDAQVIGQNIIVPLGTPLPDGQRVVLLTRYRAHLRDGSAGRSFQWSNDRGIISVLRSIPWVSQREAFDAHPWGDPFTTAVSPDVHVTFTTDRPLTIASTGRPVGASADGLTQDFEAHDVRDFNFTAAPDFKTLAGHSLDGDTDIVVYSRTLPRALMLDHAQRALRAFEAKLGPYPYPRLTVSESSGGVAHESPGHIWLSPTLSATRLGELVVHEIAHQWFYALVGNDQPGQPFADESMAEFLGRWFFGDLGGPRSCARDRLDKGIGYYDGCLYDVIYTQGSTFLAGLKEEMGARTFWAALRHYVAENRFRFGGTADLLNALYSSAQAVGVDLRPRLAARFPRFY